MSKSDNSIQILKGGNDNNEDDDYEDTASDTLISQANKILNEKEVTEENFKFFAAQSPENLMKILGQVSNEKAEKLMSYLSKQKFQKKDEKPQKGVLKNKPTSQNNQTSNQQQVNFEKKEYFNPSAPVWLDEKVQGQEGQSVNNPTLLNQLLREHEDEQNLKSGRKNRKFRMDPSQYQFEEMAKFHEKQNSLYPFYSVVAKVMYCYGDLLQNEERAVEMMHSQIEEMLKAIFEKKIVQKLIKYCKQNSQNLYELDDDAPATKEKFVFPKATKTIKRCFNQYFQTIFAEQFRVYQRFRETYQGIKEEGGFYKNNKERKGQKEESSSDISSEDENNRMEYEDYEAEDHQLREMKDHFDREDEEDMNDNDQSSRKTNKNETQDKSVVKQNGIKKDVLLFDDNDDDEDDEDETEGNQEEIQETMDTLNQIEKIAKMDEENKKDTNEPIQQESTTTTTTTIAQENQTTPSKKQIMTEINDNLIQKGDRIQFNEEDRIRFNKERTDDMSNEEWNYFMSIRSTTFTSGGNRKFFVDFLNINKYSNQFLECINVFIPFLSYCLCKIIGLVVEQSLRHRANGQLNQAENFVTEREVQLFGNSVIERYINRAKRHVLSKEKLIRAAFNLFNDEFIKNGYDKILIQQDKNVAPKQPKKQTATKSENQANQPLSSIKIQEEIQNPKEDQNIREQWKGMKSTYKKMWVERVISEKQIKKIVEEKMTNKDSRQALQELLRTDSSQIQFINKYASYLYERVLEDMQTSWLNINYSQHFKNWFLNNDSQRTGLVKKAVVNNLQNQTRDQKRKMMKFESILD